MTENSSNAASSPESAPKKRGSTGRIIFAVVALILVGFACFVSFTETGQNIPAHVLLFVEAMFSGGSPEKERAAADAIEGFDFIVIREGGKVTSISSKEKRVDKKVFAAIPALYRIGTVNIADTDVSDEDLKSIGKLRNLVSLVLSGTAITDEGLIHLGELGELESLFLQNSQITDAGLKTLVALPNLKILDISGTKITDAGVKEIARCKTLNWLLMSQTGISDAGIEALENHPQLGRLTIRDTKISKEAIEKLIKSQTQATSALRVDSESAPKERNSEAGQAAPPADAQVPAEEKSDEKKSEPEGEKPAENGPSARSDKRAAFPRFLVAGTLR
ncbi:MAG: hypothetical protein IT426_04240 [Pirellulales bacterium]|nr:hypothetical protein [Pirellulales bacterium]